MGWCRIGGCCRFVFKVSIWFFVNINIEIYVGCVFGVGSFESVRDFDCGIGVGVFIIGNVDLCVVDIELGG